MVEGQTNWGLPVVMCFVVIGLTDTPKIRSDNGTLGTLGYAIPGLTFNSLMELLNKNLRIAYTYVITSYIDYYYYHFYLIVYQCSDVKSVIIMYDDTKVFERHHVALKINNCLH